MNYLAHLYLAGPTDASRIGNLLGDFVKGTPTSLEEDYPVEVIAGIVMHRKLDRFTDRHEQFLRARNLLAPERRRFAGIVVDIFFDHFLFRHWHEYSGQPLPLFIEAVHASLQRHPDWLSPKLASVAPRLRSENWLHNYGSPEGISRTLERIAQRSSRMAPIKDSIEDLLGKYNTFEETFLRFFPDARSFAATLL